MAAVFIFMSQFFQIHPDNPQLRLVRQAAELVKSSGVIALPTDACYVLACQLDDKAAVERLRRIRQIDDKHHLTLLCRDLSEIAQYARIDNRQYRILKSATPGPYTFILEASREVPRRVSHPSRKTIGLRVPDHVVTLALMEALGQPLLGTTLVLPGHEEPLTDPWEVREHLEKLVDLVIESGPVGTVPTTVIDLSGDQAVLVRQGRGDTALFGL